MEGEGRETQCRQNESSRLCWEVEGGPLISVLFSHSKFPASLFLEWSCSMYKGGRYQSLCPGDSKTKAQNAISNSCYKQEVRVIVWNSHFPTKENYFNWGCLICLGFFPVSLTILLPPFLTSLETVILTLALFFGLFFLNSLEWN